MKNSRAPRCAKVLATAYLLFQLGSPLLAQKGKDAAESYLALGPYIPNRYTSLASAASSGGNTVSVTSITDLAGSTTFTNSINPYTTDALSAGDLIMIIQMQGADITTTDDSAYGSVTAFNGTGRYEVLQVQAVSGSVITVTTALQYSYGASGRLRSQVVRIPRLTTLSVSAGVTVTGKSWDGSSGGIAAIEANGNVTINGTVSATGLGFRGGTDPSPTTTSTSGAGVTSLFRTTATGTSAGKGEGIAGTITDYASLNGANGRGAPANGGGGGNGHNAGGGGGSNVGIAGSLTGYNGSGTKQNQTSPNNWNAAWNLEQAGFAGNISPGGGRGGYTFSNINIDAITTGPGNSSWGGDYRDNVGGFGGRPLDHASNTRVFMGGGGGAGDGNNSAAGTGGGRGGGIVYLLSNGNLSGSGTISANGSAGGNTTGTHTDAASGGGGGGTVVLNIQQTISGITVAANGGGGGSQLITATEAEGGGGGGGGGYILSTATLGTWTVSGGANGVTNSSALTEFTPNGTTAGSAGTINTRPFADVVLSVLPVRFLSLSAKANNEQVQVLWQVDAELLVEKYVVERSMDGRQFTEVGEVGYKTAIGTTNWYQYVDGVTPANWQNLYYRIRETAKDGSHSFSKMAIVRRDANKQFYIQITGRTGSSLYPVQSHNNSLPFELVIYDGQGRLLARRLIGNPAVGAIINITPPPGANGILFMKIVSANSRITYRLGQP